MRGSAVSLPYVGSSSDDAPPVIFVRYVRASDQHVSSSFGVAVTRPAFFCEKRHHPEG